MRSRLEANEEPRLGAAGRDGGRETGRDTGRDTGREGGREGRRSALGVREAGRDLRKDLASRASFCWLEPIGKPGPHPPSIMHRLAA